METITLEMDAAKSPAEKILKLPFLTPGGDLSIPFDSDPKYHWWKPGGQSVEQTRAEVQARMAVELAQHGRE